MHLQCIFIIQYNGTLFIYLFIYAHMTLRTKLKQNYS
jgi:hypothetical protein